MRYIVCMLALCSVLTVRAQSVELPEALMDAVPEGTEEFLDEEAAADTPDLSGGIQSIFQHMRQRAGGILHQRLRGAVQILLVVFLCGLVESGAANEKTALFLPMVGALSITALTVGSLDSLLGLGSETIRNLSSFARVLLPILAAAAAAAGGWTVSTVHQVAAVFFVNLLFQMIDRLLLPLTGLYIGLLTAGACLQDGRLTALADGLKKIITWVLCTALFLFTGYLSAARILTGPADSAAVKLTKSALSGVVPVVGSIIAEAAETVLAGAGLLKGAIGIFGVLTVLAACAYPFLQLGIQYILYKITAFLSTVLGVPGLCKLIGGLGGAFGLVLGMTGSCALLLLISVLSSAAAVVT